MKSIIVYTSIIMTLFACSVQAQRTTPTEVTNTPTVSIDATNNVVKTPTQQKMVQLWATDRSMYAGSYITSDPIDCAGYKELRIVILKAGQSGYASDWDHVTVAISFHTAADTYVSIGSGCFTTNSGIVTGGNFEPLAGILNNCCIMSMPVISDKIKITVHNYAEAGVTVSSGSYVYLVN